MHNNYYFLRKLAAELHGILKGCVVSECFSQNREELIIRFETSGKPFFIKASMQSDFACLSFPTDFNRARINSVDLFPELIGHYVEDIQPFDNERSFSIRFTNHYQLLFKMHGSRSNLILFEHDQPVAMFRNHLENDWRLNPNELARTIDWSEEAFKSNPNNLQQLYFTFGKVVWSYLDSLGFESCNPSEQWVMIQNVRNELDDPTYYITFFNQQVVLSLVPVGEIELTLQTPVAALHEFFMRYTSRTSFAKIKQDALARLTVLLKNGNAYLKKGELKKAELEQDDHYKRWADLIMANLHQIKTGMKSISLPDFYQENKLIEIKLKPDLTPQKNAEVYYRKARNHHIETEKLSESLEKKKAELEKVNDQIHQLQSVTDLKTLRQLITSFGFTRPAQSAETNLPYHEFECMGFRIWVGKNAKSNDELTLKYAYKEDLWLHAKDVPGSHVVIKYQSGKKFPKEVIERAAQLAAYNSKRKTESLCPVVVTPKKFVRKRKGDEPGSVIVEKEEVILVEPKLM